jgi:hypothetical protein
MRILLIFCCLLVPLLVVNWAFAEDHVIAGQGVTLTMSSPNAHFLAAIDLNWPSEDCYAYFEPDSVTYNMAAHTGYTVSTAYLYYGDGTGQFISPGTNYSHSIQAHTNAVASLCVIYSDSTTEELLCPRLFEAWYGNTPPYNTAPDTYYPPVTTNSTVNSMLSNNSDSPLVQVPRNRLDFHCICGIENKNCGATNIDPKLLWCSKREYDGVVCCGNIVPGHDTRCPGTYP